MMDEEEKRRKRIAFRITARFYLKKIAKALLILILIFSFFYFLQPLERQNYQWSIDAFFRGEYELAGRMFVSAASKHPFYQPFVKFQEFRRKDLDNYRKKMSGN